MENIIPRSVILECARRAVDSGLPIHQVEVWPVGSAAGQAFQREVERIQVMREASKRIRKLAGIPQKEGASSLSGGLSATCISKSTPHEPPEIKAAIVPGFF